MTFASPWDRSLRISTAAVVAVALGGVALLLAWGLPATSRGLRGSWTVTLAVLVLPAILLGAWALAPRRLTLVGTKLRVERPLWAVEIETSGLRAVAPLSEGSLGGAVRILGTSGFCGYYGRFYSRSLGSFRLYATRRVGLVCLDTASTRFVVSPEPPEAFVEAVRARAPEAAAAPLPARNPVRAVAGRRVAVAVAVAALGLAAGGLLSGFGRVPVGVSVDEEGVRVERRLAEPVRIPFRTILRVAPLTAEERRGWVRTAGTSMGAAAYGRFYGPALGSFRLYAWRQGGYVLLDTDEERVVVTVESPERFAEEVRSRLAPGPG